MMKRILAMAMVLIVAAGSSPLSADASDLMTGLEANETAVVEAPVEEETDEIQEEATVQNDTMKKAPANPADSAEAGQVNVNTDATSSDAANVDAPKADVPQTDTKDNNIPDKDTQNADSQEKETPESSDKKDVPAEEEKVADAVDGEDPEDENTVTIEGDDVPLAGPVGSDTLAVDGGVDLYAMGDSTGVFQVTTDEKGYHTDGNNLGVAVNLEKNEEKVIYVLPNSQFKVNIEDRDGGEYCWWRWEMHPGDGAYRDVFIADVNGEYVPYNKKDGDNVYTGRAISDGKYRSATIKIAENSHMGMQAQMRACRGDFKGLVPGFSAHGKKETYRKIYAEKDPSTLFIHIAKECTVTYDMNDSRDSNKATGTIPKGVCGVTYGYTTGNDDTSQVMTITDVEPARNGYVFKGWNTAADGSGTSYQTSDTFKMKENMTLYAQWETDYTIEYYKDAESVETQIKTGMEGQFIPSDLYAENRYEGEGFYFQKMEDFNGNLVDPKTGIKITYADGKPLLKVYYVSKADYTIVYYKDGVEVKADTVNGKDAPIGEYIYKLIQGQDEHYFENKYFGYSLKEGNPNKEQKITVNSEANVLEVHYVKTSGDLTITTQAAASGETQIFRITGDNGFSMEVSISSRKDSVTVRSLPAGSYTVTRTDAWNWRYASSGSRNVEVKAYESQTVDFGSLGNKIKYWYGAEIHSDNMFKTRPQEGGQHD